MRIESTGSKLPNNNLCAHLSNTDIRTKVKVTRSHLNSEWHSGHGAMKWSWPNFEPQPSSCSICCHDLDITCLSFLSCLCRFWLCLFCHKRILEAVARRPICRKLYDCVNSDTCSDGGATNFRVAQSMSASSKRCYV